MTDQKGCRLAEIINRPDFQRLVLGAYEGAYSLGVTRLRGSSEQVLVLEVEMKNPTGFPKEIIYEGRIIPLIVNGSFRRPKAHRRKSHPD